MRTKPLVEVADQVGQGVEMVEKQFCTKGFGSGLAIAVEVEREGFTSCLGGFGVNFTVADEQDAGAAKLRLGRAQRGRVGFALHEAVTPDDQREMTVKTEVAQNSAGRCHRFVGADRHWMAAGGKGIQRLCNTGIKGCQINGFFVVVDKFGNHLAMPGTAVGQAPAGQKPRHKDRHAIADEATHGGKVERRIAMRSKDAVGRRMDIGRGIDQRAVKIENQAKRISQLRHQQPHEGRGCSCRRAQDQSPSRP
jgi:hypothetical protein